MNLQTLLQSFGLSETESQTYLAALKKPHFSVSELTKDLDLKRPTLYHALETLEQKGLIVSIGHSKVVRFRAEPVEQLKSILKRKELELKSLEKKLDKAIPFFPGISEQTDGVIHQIEYFRGKESLQNLGERIFQAKKKELLAMNPPFSIMEKFMDEEWGLQYLEERAKRGIHTKTLWQDMPTYRGVDEHQKYFRDVRMLPVKKFGEFKTSIQIFDNNVVIFNFLPELFGVLIQSFHYSETMRLIFQ